MRTNLKTPGEFKTHEGAPAIRVTATKELRRAVMSCMLFEAQFYESGVDSAARIAGLIKQVPFSDAAQVAIDAREKFKLRHMPLFVLREMLRIHKGRQMGDLIARVIQRPDELGELLALYWKDDKNAPITSQMKIGLSRAVNKFSPYQLAKWDKDSSGIKLKDVLFLCHTRPKVSEEAEVTKVAAINKPNYHRGETLRHPGSVFSQIVNGTLKSPDTWEVSLSAGGDKKTTFSRLISEKKLGALALLRNLRGMLEVGVDEDKIREGLSTMNTERVLPFRFITAARYAPRLEDALEAAMFRCAEDLPILKGKTALLIDHSGSMQQVVSAKSEITRFDAAGSLAMILRETAERCRIFTFSNRMFEVPPRRGFALLQAVRDVVNPVGTMLGSAVRELYRVYPECDRIIVITDEQSADRPPHPQGHGYIVNVGGAQHGISYGPWVSIDGWSEAIIDYVRLNEEEDTAAVA